MSHSFIFVRMIQVVKARAIFFGVLVFAVVLLMAGMLLPGENPSPVADMPWQIEHNANGIRVFGLTLGHSTLDEAQNKFHESAKISLFVSDAGKLAVEAYFDRISLSGLSAKVVLTAALSQVELQGMYERGLRTSALGSGRKVELRPDDKDKVLRAEIAGITYLPSSSLDEALIAQRFGTPSRRVREVKNDVLHLLYPQSGLDIMLSRKNKAVLQYFPPQDFETLMAPILALPATD